jgi:NAD(P)H-dependent flavin oxidoreductase YrpB (nitropropane dioxygenase family)
METALTRMFGCRHPLQLAGMGGWSTPELAIAVGRAGGIGMLSGALSPDDLGAQLDAVPDGVVVGVNFLMPFLDLGMVEAAARRAPLVEFFWADPSADLVARVHAGGSRAGWQVGSADEAKAAVDAGCDVVVAQGVGGGGHVRGTVDAIELLSQVVDQVDVPIIAAGGFGTGKDIAAALSAGAAGVRLGTRFLAATESVAHPAYVDQLIASSAADTVVTTAFGEGWPDAPHRVLRSCLDAGKALGEAQVWSPDWPMADYAGDPTARPLYAGYSVDAVTRRQPAAEIVEELMSEALL